MARDCTTNFESKSSNSMNESRNRVSERGIDTVDTNGALATSRAMDARRLEKAESYWNENASTTYPKVMTLLSRIFIETIPHWLSFGAMLGLIFGGCCSNVFALEAIVKAEPQSGTLITFVQFLFVAVTGYISQFDHTRPPFYLRPNHVPLRRWMINILLFFTINVLNNHAFSYNISVPMHIILRSGGSITTLIAGYVWGKRFSRVQVASVSLLTLGVIIAAWTDQQAKKNIEVSPDVPPFSTGLGILFIAQILSALMGLYTEETYKIYGPYWRENLFYSHLLGLPLFIPFIPSMNQQFLKLAASSPIKFSTENFYSNRSVEAHLKQHSIHIPSQLVYVFMNVLTQYACVRGVNLLAAVASALTVTLVLNIRKLVSLLLSIWLFGNTLSLGTLVGAFIVFFAGGLYGMEGSRSPGLSRKISGLENSRSVRA